MQLLGLGFMPTDIHGGTVLWEFPFPGLVGIDFKSKKISVHRLSLSIFFHRALDWFRGKMAEPLHIYLRNLFMCIFDLFICWFTFFYSFDDLFILLFSLMFYLFIYPFSMIHVLIYFIIFFFYYSCVYWFVLFYYVVI